MCKWFSMTNFSVCVTKRQFSYWLNFNTFNGFFEVCHQVMSLQWRLLVCPLLCFADLCLTYYCISLKTKSGFSSGKNFLYKKSRFEKKREKWENFSNHNVFAMCSLVVFFSQSNIELRMSGDYFFFLLFTTSCYRLTLQ